MHKDRTSSVNWLNRAVLSTALNSSMVLKFLNKPFTGIEWEGILKCRDLYETRCRSTILATYWGVSTNASPPMVMLHPSEISCPVSRSTMDRPWEYEAVMGIE